MQKFQSKKNPTLLVEAILVKETKLLKSSVLHYKPDLNEEGEMDPNDILIFSSLSKRPFLMKAKRFEKEFISIDKIVKKAATKKAAKKKAVK